MIGENKKEERVKRGQKREMQDKYDKKKVKRREKEKGTIL
jgi:hypothetical protein